MSYILIVGTVLLGLFSLYKDWQNYKHPWIRRAVAVVLVIMGAGSTIKQFRDNSAAQNRENNATASINALKSEVAALHGAQAENTKAFLQTLNGLSERVREMQTEVKTDQLQKKLANVQADLQRTQKALAPEPKPNLLFTFFPFALDKDPPTPVTSVSLPLNPNGTVHVEYAVMNNSNKAMGEGQFSILICSRCRFASEPKDFYRYPGQDETVRSFNFSHLWGMTFFSPFSVDIIPPVGITTFPIGFDYRCADCVPQKQTGTVHLITR
jgi:hypothetical protein